MRPLYKILSAEDWQKAQLLGHLPWSAKDQADGFVHLSAEDQVKETAEKHFGGAPNLVLLLLEAQKLSDLRWEPSRGGALFPHVYANVPVAAVRSVHRLVGPLAGQFDWPAALKA